MKVVTVAQRRDEPAETMVSCHTAEILNESGVMVAIGDLVPDTVEIPGGRVEIGLRFVGESVL